MVITEVNSGEVILDKNGVKGQRIYDKDNAKVIHMAIVPGGKVERHSTPVDVLFYVLEGRAWIEIGDERKAVDSNSIVESPKDIPHAIENYSDKDILKVLVVKFE